MGHIFTSYNINLEAKYFDLNSKFENIPYCLQYINDLVESHHFLLPKVDIARSL